MTWLLETFNNREIAAAIWLIVLLAWVGASSPRVRESAIGVVKTFFSPKILACVLAMLTYVAIVVFALRSADLWESALLKDTVLWTLFVAIAMLFDSSKAHTDERYFRKAAADGVKVMLLVEFLVNTYVFPLWLELLLFPLLLVVSLMKAIADNDEAYRIVRRPLEWLLVLYGLAVIAFSVRQAALDPGWLVAPTQLRALALAPLLTLAYLPFIYLFALFLQYDRLFTRLAVLNTDRDLVRQAKRGILRRFLLNLPALNRWLRTGHAWQLSKTSDVQELVHS